VSTASENNALNTKGSPVDPTHVPVLDGVRGLAIATVLVFHLQSLWAPTHAAERAVWRVVDNGWLGVDLFFVLSGFLISGILLDTANGPGYFKVFYIRRALRIFPLYYGALVVLFWILPLTRVRHDPAYQVLAGNQAWLWGYATNMLLALRGWKAVPFYTSHFWSLAVEEQFYIFWPFVVLACVRLGRNGGRMALIGTAGVGILLGAGLRYVLAAHGASQEAIGMPTPARWDGLLVGAALAAALREWPLAVVARIIVPAGIVALAIVLLGKWIGLPVDGPYAATYHIFCAALAFGALLTMALVARPKVLAVGIAPILGRYSYGMYVLHVPIQSIIAKRFFPHGAPVIGGWQLPGWCLLVAATTAVTFAAAFVSWNLYEKHWLALKRYFPYVGRTAVPANSGLDPQKAVSGAPARARAES
jgi:peptidoglycan/LPS O-acetylase OafA/YrhL